MDKVINRLINDHVNGADTYRTKDSTWIIFTESKKWVIELTHEGTLWYNFHFFKGIFSYLSLNVIDEQHYITKWVEDTVINGVRNTMTANLCGNDDVEEAIQNGVRNTCTFSDIGMGDVEDVIQNGVKSTKQGAALYPMAVEDVIQYGVKEISEGLGCESIMVEDVIKNGVKKILSVEEGTFTSIGFSFHVEEAIKNGLKDTKPMDEWVNSEKIVDKTIQNGVKETKGTLRRTLLGVGDIIQNGVKDVKPAGYLGSMTMGSGKLTHSFETPEQNEKVEDVIENGFKRTIQNKIKSTIRMKDDFLGDVEHVIQNGIKETHYDAYKNQARVDGVIKIGLKSDK